MNDETATNQDQSLQPESGEGTGVATPEAQDELGFSLEGGQPQDGQAQTTEDEFEEIEHEGSKYSIPKALKPALMFQADYTRKTQELADQRRAFEADRVRYTQASQEHIQSMAKLVAMDEQLDALNKVDWRAFTAEDPIQAQQTWMQFSQMKDARQQLAVQLQQQEQQRALGEQQEIAKRIEESRAVLARDIKGWSQQTEDQVVKFLGETYGFSTHDIARAYAPPVMKMAYDAWMGQELMKKQIAATQRPAATPIRPVPQVGSGAAPAGVDPARMSDDEWLAARTKGRAKR